MILTLTDIVTDLHCPELHNAFNATPLDLTPETMTNGPQDAHTFVVGYGDDDYPEDFYSTPWDDFADDWETHA